MNKILTIFVLFLSLLSFLGSSVLEVGAAEDLKPDAEGISSKKLDKEAQILQKYLAQFESPMQYHAQDFIDAAREYNLDWKLLPAIAGVESTFGKQIPGGYNGWGWGVYGNQAIFFNSWKEGIFTVSKGLRENYLDKGLTDPYSMNKIYAESRSWGKRVAYFMADLDKFAKTFEAEKFDLPKVSSDPKIAAVSASPVLR